MVTVTGSSSTGGLSGASRTGDYSRLADDYTFDCAARLAGSHAQINGD